MFETGALGEMVLITELKLSAVLLLDAESTLDKSIVAESPSTPDVEAAAKTLLTLDSETLL